MSFVGAIFFFAAGQAVVGVILLVFALLNVLYVYLVRHRIPFAAAVLEICAFVIREYTAMIWFAYLGIIMQTVWMFIWAIAAATSLYSLNNAGASDNSQGVVYFFPLVSFYWSAQVVKNIVHVTCAGTLATWYFMAPDNMPPNPTRAAFKRYVPLFLSRLFGRCKDG